MIRKKLISTIICLSLLLTLCPVAVAAGTATGADAVASAQSLVGKYPYVSGGRSPSNGGFDCSGLIYYVYHTCLGCNVTYDQIWSRSVPGAKITDKQSLLPGDIIFGRNNSGGWHTGLYCGNNTMIHAGSNKGVSRTSINGTWFTFKFATRPNFTSNISVVKRGLPSDLKISINKDLYSPNETVVITPSANNATHYAISVWFGPFKTGERLYVNYNLPGGIMFSPPKAGTYTIRADAKNSTGYISTEKTFTVAEATPSAELPSNLSVSIDKNSYVLGESVSITPSADNATHYAISIWRGAFDTGEQVYADFNLYGGITFTPTQEGNYTIRADAKNSAGYISTEKTFTVTAGSTREVWGPWSDWSSNYVEATPTRQVESRPIRLSDENTEYRYGRFVDSTGAKVCWCKTYLESWSSVTGSAALQYSDWSSTRYSPNGKIWGCGFCNGDHIGVNYISEDGRAWWSQYELPGEFYYWEETRTVEPTYGTVYRYRDRISG